MLGHTHVLVIVTNLLKEKLIDFLCFLTSFSSTVNPCEKDENYRIDVCGKIASKLYSVIGKPKFKPGFPKCIDVTIHLTESVFYHDFANTLVRCGLVEHQINFGRGINLNGALLYNCKDDNDMTCYPGDDVENVMY